MMRLLVACAVLALLHSGEAASLIAVEEEIALGRAAQRELQSRVPAYGDPRVTAYVKGVGERLARHAPGPRYPYTFSVAAWNELNAFALPGGPVWVHAGLLRATADESQLAAVLAHEIAHIAARHAADRLTKGLVTNGLLGLLGAMLGTDGGARTARIGAQLLAGGYLLKFSREDEREADRLGLQLMRRAGWDGRGMLDVLERLRQVEGRDPGSVARFLSTHPAPSERIDLLRGQMVSGGRRDSAEFRTMKARLAKR